MKNHTVQDQNRIFRAMEDDILALIVIDIHTDEYEVLYSDGGYRDYDGRSRRQDFFTRWEDIGIRLIDERDRDRIREEIRKDRLLFFLEKSESFQATCRFTVTGRPVFCRIKVRKDVLEPETMVISIRDIDREIRQEQERLLLEKQQREDLEEMEETLRQMKNRRFVSQMHPHFLYNALSSIREIILTDAQYGADLLYDFMTFLRAGMRALTNDAPVLLSQEMENVRAYANIEKMRMGSRLTVEYDLGDFDFEILPLSIQPLVENAIRHGIYESGRKDGLVRICTGETEADWIITVTDNGTGFDVEETRRRILEGEQDSTGLYNLIFRLKNMMGAETEIASAPGAGTEVTVRIPKKQAPEGSALNC